MNAQVIVGKTLFTIRGADHLKVDGELVEIQRATPTGYETLAVAGGDLFVTIEPAAYTSVEAGRPGVRPNPVAGNLAGNDPAWLHVCDPLD